MMGKKFLKIIKHYLGSVAVLWLLMAGTGWALTVPDIRGTWTASPYTFLQTGCQFPEDNVSFTGPGGETLNITKQNGGNFDISNDETYFDTDGNLIRVVWTSSGTVASNEVVNTSSNYSFSLMEHSGIAKFRALQALLLEIL